METINYFLNYLQDVRNSHGIADKILLSIEEISDESQLAQHLMLYHNRLVEWQSPHKKESLIELINTLIKAINVNSEIEVIRRIMMIIAFTYHAFPDCSGEKIADGILSILSAENNIQSSAILIDSLNQIINKSHTHDER